MKRAFVSSFCLLLMFSGIALADLNDGLMAYYPFDGNPNDMSGNGYHAIPHGAVLTEDRFGNPDSAYEITGNEGPSGENWIELPDMIEGFDNLTISIWVNEYYIGYIHGDAYIWFGRDGVGYRSVAIWDKVENDPDYLKFCVSNSEGSPGCGTTFSDSWRGAWQHYVLVYDGESGLLRCYHNGSFLCERLWLPGDIVTYGSYAGLGTHWGGGGGKYHRFNGIFDDVRIYNRVLSEAEVQELFNEGTNLSPNANAGPDQIVYYEAILDGSNSEDPDGSIVSYEWYADLDGQGDCETYIGDGAVLSLSAQIMESLELYGKITKFELTVMDNDGGTGTDTSMVAATGPDPAVDELRQMVDELQKACSNLSNHTHSYLTIRGPDANKVEKQTGPPE